MSAISDSIPSTSFRGAAAHAKPLWVAIGVLSVAVLGMGGVLINAQMTKPGSPVVATAVAAAPEAPVAPLGAPVLVQPEPKAAPAVTAKHADVPAHVAAKPVKVVSKAPDSTHTKTPVAVAQAPTVPAVQQPNLPAGSESSSSSSAPSPMQQSAPATVVVQAPARPVCLNCGSVESVTPIERAGSPVGIGAVAGGVLGAVVGNQVGQGNGRTVGAILGALGGGFAGNAVEKNMKKSTAYDVRVRMEDGSLRSFEQATPLSAGDKVLVDNRVLRLAPRAAAVTTHTVVGSQTAPAKVYTSD